ncbi:MAG: lysylphosphatidylglycerol synthase transmembrane domain-containing protein [Bacteriovoracaceae bacterium]
MAKKILINIAKFAVSGALIFWLISSGKLDFKLLLALKDHPSAVASALFFAGLNIVIVSWRWRLILTARTGQYLPLRGIINITWIGQFFSSVLPGSVSGDLIKIIYIRHYDKNLSKKFLFASIFIDRLMGLAGLILLVGISSIIFGTSMDNSIEGFNQLIKMNFILVGVVLGAMVIFFLGHRPVERFLTILKNRIGLGKVFDKIINLWSDLGDIRPKMLKAVCISLIVQFIGVLVFWSLISPFVGEQLDFIHALCFIPIGLMTLALPVAPGGLGVGHAIFQKLFEMIGLTNGASLFNLYFVLTLVVNIFGIIPYLFGTTKKSLTEDKDLTRVDV